MTRFNAMHRLAFALLASPAVLAQFPASPLTTSSASENETAEAGEMKGEEGEEEDEIETDRDSFTPATTVVGWQRLVVESAYSFIDNRRVPETHSLPEIVFRYGISDWIELRFGTNYEVGGAGNPISGNVPDDLTEGADIEDEANVSYGVKFQISNQLNQLPSSALLLQAFTPTAGEATDKHFVATYVSGWIFESGCAWDSALRYSTGSFEEDHFNVWSPSTVLKVPVGESWKAHIEYFGVFSEGRETESTQHFISPGIHYLIISDWEIGVRVGWGLNDQSPNFFANVGGGYRF